MIFYLKKNNNVTNLYKRLQIKKKKKEKKKKKKEGLPWILYLWLYVEVVLIKIVKHQDIGFF